MTDMISGILILLLIDTNTSYANTNTITIKIVCPDSCSKDVKTSRLIYYTVIQYNTVVVLLNAQ